MGICRHCHQTAGWFTEAHDACVQKTNAGIESVKKCMAAAVIESKQYSDVSATIDKLTADAAIPQDQVRAALRDPRGRSRLARVGLAFALLLSESRLPGTGAMPNSALVA